MPDIISITDSKPEHEIQNAFQTTAYRLSGGNARIYGIPEGLGKASSLERSEKIVAQFKMHHIFALTIRMVLNN